MRRDELLEMLAEGAPRVTALIGGGGKTTLLFALGDFMARRGKRVVLTTTTHLGYAAQAVSPASPAELNGAIRPGKALLAAYPDGARHKMTGIPLEWYSALQVDHILVEADGSRCRPLKVHRAFEPVLPPDTGLLVQVAGLSALGRPAGEAVHCYDIVGLSPEAPVDEETVAALLERGFGKAGFSGPKLALLNQADTPELVRRGENIAAALAQRGFPAALTCLKGRKD
ncbi:MAG: putative selenium-dependent hydroxylase accessory protein YqeC [Oscillospiraceae bacterium]|nr:putative selenium-dependent hydroxylase accessory protein YqeC [Oscillospiraceae bacterium]